MRPHKNPKSPCKTRCIGFCTEGVLSKSYHILSNQESRNSKVMKHEYCRAFAFYTERAKIVQKQ